MASHFIQAVKPLVKTPVVYYRSIKNELCCMCDVTCGYPSLTAALYVAARFARERLHLLHCVVNIALQQCEQGATLKYK